MHTLEAPRWSAAEAVALSAGEGIFVQQDPDSREQAGRDFGQVEKELPWGVAAPRDLGELARLVAFAAARGLPVTVRGRGYSQSGQSLSPGGLTLDCRRLDRIDRVDVSRRRVRCEGGARWREVVAATLPYGLLPAVLPLNLDMSVAGLLSAGGIGANSHRLGPVVAHAHELEVVTAVEGPLRCDPIRHRDLYNGVLAGLGRCGVIAQATLALRPVLPRVRTFHLLYGDLDSWLADQKKIVAEGAAEYIEGFVWSSAKGMRSDLMGNRPFSHWMYGLQVGIEYRDREPDPDTALAGLQPWKIVHVQDEPVAAHIERFQPRFDGMRQSGAWQQLHPWLECLLPVSRFAEMLPAVLDALPPSIGDGHRAVWVARDGAPPFFALPDKEPAICLGILPTGVPASERDFTLQAFRQIDHTLRAAGGKRYLSGWLGPMTDDDWRQHHGPHHAAWVAAKRRYDPEGIFRSALFPRP
jgi:cytokinin dehydrogenase